jgi:hypothetical protein
MATRNYGNKHYYQVLLDPARAELLERAAAVNGVRPTHLIREMVYLALKRTLEDEYTKAEAQDAATWKQSVQNRVEGRAKARAERLPPQTTNPKHELEELIARIFE